MIVTAALPWWNELPDDLYRCVRSLENIADRLVALDGAYARYPEATVRSSADECEAIRDAATDAGIEATIIQPDRLWAGQVEKRSYLLAMASIGSHWIATLDADHIIKADREAVRKALRRELSDVIDVPYVTPIDPDRKMKDAAVGKWHEDQTVGRMMVPHLWRVLPGMKVEKFHWWYSAHKNGYKVWLWGGDGEHPTVQHSTFKRNYEVEHRSLFRTDEQIRLSRAFLNDRQMVVEATGQEDDRPGLPRPQFDYAPVPW